MTKGEELKDYLVDYDGRIMAVLKDGVYRSVINPSSLRWMPEVSREEMFGMIRNLPLTQDSYNNPVKGEVITVIDERLNLEFKAKVEGYKDGKLTLTSIVDD